MKISSAIARTAVRTSPAVRPGKTFNFQLSTLNSRSAAAFTLIEIAISLAVIGIALVAIIGVLPLGMNVQRDNREGTIVNQDASVFLEAISKGARGLDDLTNYVYAITNYQTHYVGGVPQGPAQVFGYTYSASSPTPNFQITNGYRIIGLLSTPQFVHSDYTPTNNLYADLNGSYSNHIVAYVRSLSGSAVEKPPQDNSIVQQDAFAYRLLCVNAAVPVDTNNFFLPVNEQSGYDRQLAGNLHELRLTFFWPILPNGRLGNGRQSYRTLVAGQVSHVYTNGNDVYFYQSQSFTNAP